ncbi:MAG: hypothetical protein JST14_16125 [Bacteroidetes bacterium]|nr:hypothetical protein [Bacteroidota bacterium]
MKKKNSKADKGTSGNTNEDFYWENGFMVFTEAYHKKRGYCCQSGCRHCPYGFKKQSVNKF